MPGGSVDDEAVTAVVLTDQAAGNVQRFQLQTEPAHLDAQLFGLVFARPPAQALRKRLGWLKKTASRSHSWTVNETC